ncbi:MAG: hypothetical protein RLZZ436_2472 [Planctomycetota bacterium]|jgi:Ca-activated chloride channel family protein
MVDASQLTESQWWLTLAAAIIAATLTAAAELLHSRRIHRLRTLLFGPSGQPRRWARTTPALRCLAFAAAAWACVVLLLLPPQIRVPGQERQVPFEKLKHAVLVLDVSPSMRLQDAGVEGKQSRMVRAREVMESWFRRIPMNEYRVTVIATYTKALPVVLDTKDIAVVENILNDLPMHFAFKPGETDLFSGIQAAADLARGWRPKSTTVVLVSDGDTVPATGMPKMPASVADVVVVGVGDPVNGTFLNGRNSKQDVSTLRQIAVRLKGVYHNGNDKHLPTELLRKLTLSAEGPQRSLWTLRQLALTTLLIATFLLATIPVLLHYFGSPWLPGVRRFAPLSRQGMDKATFPVQNSEVIPR